MDFLNQDFNSLEEDTSQFHNNFQQEFSCFSRRTFLFHALHYLIHARKEIAINDEQHRTGLSDEQLKNIREIDSSMYLSRLIAEQYQKIIDQKQNKEPLDSDDIFKLITKTFLNDFLFVIGVYCIDAFVRLGFSILILYLFNSVNQGDLTIAYVYTAILIVLWYCSQLTKQLAFTQGYILSSRIKSALAMLLYAKLSKMTTYVIKSSELGKITNLLASDLGVIEQRMAVFLNSFTFPIVMIGCTVILITRLGWPGIIGVIIVALIIPISNFISKNNGKLIQEINVFKDKRIRITTEVIQGIKYIKLYGWEIAFRRIIQKLREKQIQNYKKLSFGRSVERAIGNSIGYFAAFIMFLAAHYAGTGLTVSKIFSTLEIIISFKLSIFLFVIGLGFYYEAKVVFGRFASIFNIQNISMIEIDAESKQPIVSSATQKEKKNNQFDGIFMITKKDIGQSLEQLGDRIGENNNEGVQTINRLRHQSNNNYLINRSSYTPVKVGQIIFQNFCGYWKKDLTVASLKNITLRFQVGKFYGITGKVGSGKSGLLGALLGQIPYYSGKMIKNGSVGYVQQEPIIFSASIRSNILFGLPFDQTHYDQVVHVACLESDFQIFQHGDETIVGQKGITLSGGQKARLALARALYADADIYLFDDPISAVDSKVARQIFEHCLKPLSKTKTVILVTHQIIFLHECDEVVIMDDGAIKAKGSPKQLRSQLQQMSSLFKKEDEQEQDEEQQQIKDNLLQIQHQQLVEHIRSVRQASANTQEQPKFANRFSEQNATVTMGTYTRFFFATPVNYWLMPLTILLFLASEGITTAFFRFLANYSQVLSNIQNPFGNDFSLYWGILGLLMGLYFLILVIKYYCLNLSILMANQKIHQQMINGIVRSPGQFFDVTPSGMLINKFSNDLGILDNALPLTFIDMLQGPAGTIVALVNICQIDLFFIPPTVIIVIIVLIFFVYARPAIVQCKQKDLKNKSPIFQFYNQTLNGLVHIRTFNRRDSLLQQFSKIMNNSTRAAIAFDIISRGFGFYVAIAGIILMFIGMEVGINQSNPAVSGLFGVTVIFLVQFNDFLQWFLRQIITVQSFMLSSQRAFQVINLKSQKQLRTQYDRTIGLKKECDAAQNDDDLHQEWPDKPSIQFTALSARYKDDLPLVLKDISFTVKPYEKIGIVGRTGAGKSSIIQALFRVIEPEIGSKYQIGGFNALQMGLHSLRQHISVIPQTPFLFKGSVRQNVDPFSTSSQQAIWRALEQSGLIAHVKSLPQQLQTDISNTSQSFSVGQKQLLCLARALLRRNKILVLDQATSNVDMTTDTFIQNVIRQRFADTTVITIAHRLNTVADYDKIVVMQRGKILEIGSPYQLIQKRGTFYEMVQHTGKNAALIIAKAKSSNDIRNRQAKERMNDQK